VPGGCLLASAASADALLQAHLAVAGRAPSPVPAHGRNEGLVRVLEPRSGQPLSAPQIEDVVVTVRPLRE
jgi:hypothetical protein